MGCVSANYKPSSIQHKVLVSCSRMAMFSAFDSYKLTDVIVTENELGRGSYGTVVELNYMELKYVGKKIHQILLQDGSTSHPLKRFQDECKILSQVRHPNIVQFLGVFFPNGESIPILVMEFLPTNLTSCIEKYGIIPKEISYSILHDIALGLSYLHNQDPSITHRDLSSNIILLTPNKTAKIADLGVVRILSNMKVCESPTRKIKISSISHSSRITMFRYR